MLDGINLREKKTTLIWVSSFKMKWNKIRPENYYLFPKIVLPKQKLFPFCDTKGLI